MTDDGGASWTIAEISGSNPALRNSPISSVCLTTAGIGLAWGVGVSGTVLLRSDDGGHVWTEFSPMNGFCEGRVACAGDQDLWTFGGGSATAVMCHSTDGGASWTDLSDGVPSGGMRDLVFLDPRNGWADGFDALAQAVALRTTDGGSWRSQVLPLVAGAVFMTPQAIAATSATHVVVVGSESNAQMLLGPMALVTFDGGATWQASTLPAEVFFLQDVALE